MVISVIVGFPAPPPPWNANKGDVKLNGSPVRPITRRNTETTQIYYLIDHKHTYMHGKVGVQKSAINIKILSQY